MLLAREPTWCLSICNNYVYIIETFLLLKLENSGVCLFSGLAWDNLDRV